MRDLNLDLQDWVGKNCFFGINTVNTARVVHQVSLTSKVVPVPACTVSVHGCGWMG